MGWHHFTDHCCQVCNEPGGDMHSCHECGNQACSGCLERMTSRDFRETIDAVGPYVEEIREKRAEAAAASTDQSLVNKSADSDSDSDSSDSSDSDSDSDRKDTKAKRRRIQHRYCTECTTKNDVTKDELIAYLIPRSGFTSKANAEAGYYTMLAEAQVAQEDAAAAAAATSSTAAAAAATSSTTAAAAATSSTATATDAAAASSPSKKRKAASQIVA